jgi:hypothetical protein
MDCIANRYSYVQRYGYVLSDSYKKTERNELHVSPSSNLFAAINAYFTGVSNQKLTCCNISMDREDDLRVLGDPSGQQDADYWNEWFQIVCGGDDRSFEWYTAPSEVARLLKSFNCSQGKNPRMIHPGSGNSLVPVKLRDTFFFPHQHFVVDIADAALKQMKRVHNKYCDGGNEIKYLHCNVLDPPLPLDADSFDVWVDKGLVDALFKDCESSSASQCQTLFDEAHRLLKPCCGVLLVITMAEEHSLSLILRNWTRQLNNSVAMWQSDLNVYELEPVSGDMRPFGIVMKMATPSDAIEKGITTLTWHHFNGSTKQFALENVFDTVKSLCEESRREFHCKRNRVNENDMLLTIEMKPWDTDVDLYAVGQLITGLEWTVKGGRVILPIWQQFDDSDGVKTSIRVVPVAYGICKLVLKCLIGSDDLEDFTETLREWDGGGVAQDGFQSVDIDWGKTFRVCDLSSMAIIGKI